MTFDHYVRGPPEPEPEPQAKCPKCRRMSVEYDKQIQSWSCWSCGWRDR